MATMPRRLVSAFVAFAFAVAGAASCSGQSEHAFTNAQPEAGARLAPLGDLESVQTTADGTFSPTVARQSSADGPNPSFPDALTYYEKQGFGQTAPAAAWARLDRTVDDSPAPKSGPDRKRLLRFVHLPDLQLADDESPSRLALLDMPTQLDAAMRPHDGELCRMVNAAVRTIRAHHAKDPFQFLLLGGDNVDNAQSNELSWVLATLGGSERIKCDSGHDDDPVPGPDNDGKDPFASRGLGFPFYWVTGNHDVEVQGNVMVDDDQSRLTVGKSAPNGTRDYAHGGAPLQGDFVVADERRALMPRTLLMQKVAADGDGHGIGAAQIASGKANYSFDVPGTQFRFVVLDFAHARGGAEAVIQQSDLDAYVQPMLDQALADGKLVFLVAHHSSQNLTNNGGAFGRDESDPVLEPAWLAFLAKYPNIVGSFVGHTHLHRVRSIGLGQRRIWEVMTSALADYPNQFRIVEVYDEDNGYLSIEGTAADWLTDGDVVAADARQRAVIDYVSGWIVGGVGQPEDRNVRLWVKKP